MNFSIRWRLLITMLVLVITMLTTLTYVQIRAQQQILEEELARREVLMREKTIQRGQTLSDNLANQVAIEIAAFNFSQLTELIQIAVRDDQDLSYGILMDADLMVHVHTLLPELEQEILSSPQDLFAIKQVEPIQQNIILDGIEIIEFITPIQVSTQPWGVLRLGFSMAKVATEITQSQYEINTQIRWMVIKSVIMAGIFLVIGFVIVFIISTKISEPLLKLTQSARQLAKGNFSIQIPMPTGARDEVHVLAKTFANMAKDLEHSYAELEKYNLSLEELVAERTAELNETLETVTKSIKYAQRIQQSLLPNLLQVKTYLPNSFFLWKPRDIVGGDIFYSESLKDSILIVVVDCTGHGVPGALMTMVVLTSLKRIIGSTNEKPHDPAYILRELNFLVKTSLQQDTEYATSDDGLDAAICLIKPKEKSLTFAGAKLPLFFIRNNQVVMIKGDKQSLGYKRSKVDFEFRTYHVDLSDNISFYLTTDGFIDQLGGEKGFPFGNRRFKALLLENCRERFEVQQERLLTAFNEYKGDNERRDDLTVVGFGF